MRLLADMPVSPRTVAFLRELGHHVVHVLDIGMGRATDEEIVDRAKAEHMSVLTEDLDYGAILAATGEMEPGVVILRVGNWKTEHINERLSQVLHDISEDSFRSAIVLIERQRVRIRRLPI